MSSDRKLEGGDYLDLIEQPVLRWEIRKEVQNGALILSATLRAEPPAHTVEDDDDEAAPPAEEPAWIKEATVALCVSDQMARALLDTLQQHLAGK